MPPFDPSIGQLGLYPLAGNKATINFGLSGGNNATGHCIAYLRRVLYAYCGYTTLNPSANWGPWSFNATTKAGVESLQAMFGLPVTGIVSHTILPGETMSTWDVIDFVWAWNN